MANVTNCKRCNGENPADALFCIDCGAALHEAQTGPTRRLVTVPCPSCKAGNPSGARFCVICGADMTSVPPRPAPRPTPSAPSRPSPMRQVYPRVATPPVYGPLRPPIPPQVRHHHNAKPGAIIFIIGLLILLGKGFLWPGILAVIGISVFANEAARGRPDKGLGALIWLVGLAVLFATGAFFPGIFILFLLQHLLVGKHSWHW